LGKPFGFSLIALSSAQLDAGVSIFRLARVLGTSIQMIERHYGTLLDGSGADIARRLNAAEARDPEDPSPDSARTTSRRRSGGARELSKVRLQVALARRAPRSAAGSSTRWRAERRGRGVEGESLSQAG
jgi:hypothetical protein